MSDCKLYCLGRPILEMDGESVKLEMRKSLALLIYLRMADHDYSRESLSALFWPEYDQQHAQANLRRVLSSLNKSLQGELLEADREKIGLKDRSKVWLDVECFQGLLSATKNHTHANGQACPECLRLLEEAIQLYRGDFLEGFNLGDCPEFDEWQYLQRESLRQEFAWVLQRVAETCEAHSDWEQAIAYTRRWVALDRLHEPAQRLLISLHGQAGQRSASLRQYDEVVRILHDELGQEPEPETTALYHRIRDGTPAPPQDRVKEVPKESAAPQLAEPLLKTKLYIPSSRGQKVNRQHLIRELNQIDQYSLSVLSAPAGFGKTTSLVEWASQSSLPVGWYSLDSGDNEVVRFLTYLIAALESLQSGIGLDAQSLLRAPQPAPPQLVLTHLIHDLESLQTPFVLVLDDYQSITAQVIHDTISFFLDHLPTNMHFIIATRADPPLGLARLRSRGQLLEIRTNDLRFSPEEAFEYLNHVMGLPLTSVDVALLDNKIEGWIVGLQMAALSIQGREDTANFIKAFSGSNRYILDYLTDEVLSKQPKDIQTFLIQTSVLGRLCSSLCSSVVEWEEASTNTEGTKTAGDAPNRVRDCQAILEYLERANLFIIPLDNERCWYRYHQLFADLLQARLEQIIGKQGVMGLHLRAYRWYEQNHLVEEAVNHVLAAHDYNQAAKLIESISESTWLNGEYDKLKGWIKALPEDLVRNRPWLCIWCAWSFTQTGPLQDASRWTDAAEQALENQMQDQSSNLSTNTQAIKEEIDIIRIINSSLGQDYEKTLELALPVLEHPPTSNRSSSLIARCNILHGLSTSYYVAGELSKAEQICQETVGLAKEIGFFLRYTHAINKQTHIQRVTGRLHQSYQLLQDTLAFMRQQEKQEYFPISDLYCRLSDLFYEWNCFEDAQQMIAESLRLDEVTEIPYLLVGSYNARGHLLIAQRDLDGAQTSLQKAANLIQKSICWPQLVWENEAYFVKLWLARGDLVSAARWAQEHQPANPDAPSFAQEAYEIARARVFIARGSIFEAIDLLDQLGKSAKAAGRNGRLIEIRVLEAIAQKAGGDWKKAIFALEQALLPAEQEGYLRIFLDEGEPMKLLIQDFKIHLENRKSKIDQDTPLAAYANHLLTAFQDLPIPDKTTSQ